MRFGGGLAAWRRLVAEQWLSMRCALIGVVVGVIPGLGGSVVDWIAYGHTVQTTKDKSKFGKGEIRGVVGPESSNNAKEGGGLVPTLLFGIPGSGSMAIFIGALSLLGSGELEVGRSMLKNNLNYTYSIVWMLALANIFGTILCITLSGDCQNHQHSLCPDRAVYFYDYRFCRVSIGSEFDGFGGALRHRAFGNSDAPV